MRVLNGSGAPTWLEKIKATRLEVYDDPPKVLTFEQQQKHAGAVNRMRRFAALKGHIVALWRRGQRVEARRLVKKFAKRLS